MTDCAGPRSAGEIDAPLVVALSRAAVFATLSSMMNTALLDSIANRLGPKGVTADQNTIAPHLLEWRERFTGHTPFMAMPASTAELSDLLKLCHEARCAVSIQGGNTGLVGGQIPQGEILLSTARMNKIRSVDALNESLIAEAGVILSHVHDAADAAARMFPLSLASQGSATIGGLLSTNAGGVHVVRYGMMRDLTLGLEVVLADGRVMHGLKSLRKDNTGYDLRHIFIGAEGTLGVISAASLKLFAMPGARVVVMAGLEDSDKAITLLNRLKAETGALSAFELMGRYAVDLTVKMGARDPLSIPAPWTALIEFESAAAFALEVAVENTLNAALEDGLIIDAAIARTGAQAQDFWRLRETMPGAHKDGSAQCSHDTSVPVSAVPDFLRLCDARVRSAHPGARIVAFGHAGDGNIHYTAMQNLAAPRDSFEVDAITEIIHNTALELGGSISAEHGVGVIRRAEFLAKKDPAQVALMQAMKRAFDPLGILNPRVMV